MRRLMVCALLLAGLAACSGSSYPDRHNCSANGEVCIEVRVEEPISFGGEVTVTITVTSEKDVSDLSIILEYEPDVFLLGIQDWEKESRDVTIWDMGASWNITIEANQPLVFKRILMLPPREGEFAIRAQAATKELRAGEMIRIYLKRDGGRVYLSGTGIPRSPVPEFVDTVDPHLLETFRARPTRTATPTVAPSGTPTQPVYLTLPAQATLTQAAKVTLPVAHTPTPTKGTESPPPVIIGTPAYPPPYP